MTGRTISALTARRDATTVHRWACWMVLRVLIFIAALVTLYYWLPLDHYSTGVAVTILVIGLALLIALIAWQARLIIGHPHPGLKAVEALATTISLFLVLFASTYFVMSRLAPHSFSSPLTRTDALYFTITVFSTVGFGDITAKTQTARLVVTGQMITDLVFLGLGIRVIAGAATLGRQRRSQDDSGTQPTEETHP